MLTDPLAPASLPPLTLLAPMLASSSLIFLSIIAILALSNRAARGGTAPSSLCISSSRMRSRSASTSATVCAC